MVKFNTEFLLPKKYFDGEMIPEGIVWHGMSAIHADRIGLDNSNPFDVGVNIAILKSYNLSAHMIIDRRGEAYLLVPWSRRARHAGISLLNGRPDCNKWTVGIEFLSLFKTTKEWGPALTSPQIKTGLEVRDWLMKEFGITLENTGGHDEVRAAAIKANMMAPGSSEPPKSKPDPGKEFPWELFRPKKSFNSPLEVRATQEQILADRRKLKANNQTVPVMPDGS